MRLFICSYNEANGFSRWKDMGSYLIKPELDGNYPSVSHGKGSYVYDQEGNKYLDGASGRSLAISTARRILYKL